MSYAFLTLAILCEVVATSSLKAARGFTAGLPTLLVVAGYLCSFYFLSRTLESLPIGIAYAIWSGVGIVLVSLAGFVIYGQRLSFPAVCGMALIIAGVAVLQLFQHSAAV